MTALAASLGVFSLIGIFIFVIILIINKIKKRSTKQWRNGLFACIAIFAVAAFISPGPPADPAISEAPPESSITESSVPDPSSSINSSAKSSSFLESESSAQSSSVVSSSSASSSTPPASSSVASVPESSVSQKSKDEDFPQLNNVPDTETTQGSDKTAYWVSGGKSHHFSKDCTTLKRSKNIITGTLQGALDAGKSDPCNLCAGG